MKAPRQQQGTATAQTTKIQFGQCPPRGGCTLTIHCCGNVTCYRDLLNPNSGICGGVRNEDDGPAFILPSPGGGTDNQSGGSGPRLTDTQILVRYDRNRSGDIDCADFNCQSEAQALHDAYPGNTWRLDGDGNGVACQVYDYSRTCRN